MGVGHDGDPYAFLFGNAQQGEVQVLSVREGIDLYGLVEPRGLGKNAPPIGDQTQTKVIDPAPRVAEQCRSGLRMAAR